MATECGEAELPGVWSQAELGTKCQPYTLLLPHPVTLTLPHPLTSSPTVPGLLTRLAQRWLAARGWLAIRPHEHREHRLRELLAHQRFDLVLDVGAHHGEFAGQLRRQGYAGRIVSFEPVKASFSVLAAAAAADSNWEAVNMALGDRDGAATIHIAARDTRSSLLAAADGEQAERLIQMVADEEITVRRLDSVLPDIRRRAERILLKLDVQGFERQVLDGAAASLAGIRAIRLEMALFPRYEGELLFVPMLQHLESLGFRLALVLPGKSDPASGLLVQLDGVFLKVGSAGSAEP